MKVIWLNSIAKTFNDNPDSANNLYKIVNNSANEVKFHWTDIYALSMIADTVNGAALDYKYRSYKAGSRLFGEADLLKIYKNILAAPGARDYNSEVAGLIIQEANDTEPVQNGGQQNGGTQNGGSQNGGIPSGPDTTGTSQEKKQKQWVTYALIGLILFVIFKKRFKNGSKGKR
ncbi:hypothetical protein GCM10011325_27090 [Dyadobacter sediminis]|nr:hypothetical protein GCM10011325_27090 [Dyadobacter sediminis]